MNGAPNETNGVHKKVLPRLQIINEKQEFTKDLPPFMKDEWQIADVGFNYNLVAVFGSQSTGKSTLLNRLFGTSFDVMNENSRRQTTKGIWMSRGKDMNVLIMDVEGTDGRERGEDQDFERKSALFSMATSNVIIVNLWEHQVGLYQGANMGLLKTVFEVNLQLFQAARGKEKTLLLFVIRDHVGTTPLENLSNTLTEDLKKIWESVSKPEGLESCTITDYFDFMFAALPHKLLLPQKFEEDVIKLRERFVNTNHKEFVFKPNYSKRVPADGFHVYAEGIWDQIMSNKDLDLPTQQELLAQYRCDEIATVAFDAFLGKIKGFRQPIESGKIIEDLGPQMEEIRNATIKQFDKDASRYLSEVYKRKRQEILNKTNSQLHVFFLGQLKNLTKKAINTFNARIQEKLKGEGYDFAEVVSNARNDVETFFKNNAESIVLSQTDWTFDEEFTQLCESMNEIAAKSRIEETKKMIKNLEKNVQAQINEFVSLYFKTPTTDMWGKIIGKFQEALNKAEQQLLKKAKSFNSTEEENAKSLENLRKRSWQQLRKKIDDELVDNMFLLKLRERFEEKFRYDEEGLPKVWKPDDDIDAHFRKAREDALKLIPLFAKVQIPDGIDLDIPSDEEFVFEESLIILSETKQHDLNVRFKRESDAFYLEAKRSVVATTARVPYWVLLLIVLLGWNEFLAILTSPTYLILVSFFGFIGFIIYTLNLFGPVETFVQMIASEIIKVGKEKAYSALQQGHPASADKFGQYLDPGTSVSKKEQ
ncbi:5575_t:CDS:10 [Funneliformis geosporum]|uniref:2602_t:CDS:1 n=1 Tax=Funneliformis geosporum TaxID=1117311 RepID=A0A9W4SMK0_9GLOM|nr:5575_t:CDS:10 [Funneliformis geosporum]CAI2173852.1 2602_t:CDS:10 [Funneliformis geosporum]